MSIDWRIFGRGARLALAGAALAAVAVGAAGSASRDASTSTAAAGSGYRLQHTYAVGGDGFWDYLYLDAAARRLYVSHATHVVVLNADDGTIAGDIPNTNGVHGIAIVPELHRGYTSNGRDTTVTVFDTQTLKISRTIRVTGAGPDAIVYDAVSKRVFTFNGRGHNATAIDVAGDSVVGTIPIGGRPEFAVADGEGRLFVNVEDTSEILALDARTLAVAARWPLAPGTGPSGLAIDRANRRLFAVCENGMMVVVDATTGRVVATPPIGTGPDAARFDPATGFVFSSNGEGTLTVLHEDGPDRYRVVDTVKTQPGARTMELDPQTHAVYLPTATLGPAPAPTAENPRPRPTIVPGSFVVLVFG